MAAYPSIAITPENFVESPRGYVTVSTGFEYGYAQTRAKNTTAPRKFQFTHANVSLTDVNTWIAFWDARKGGAEAFDFTDPRTSSVISCRFKSNEPPQIVPVSAAKVAFNIGPIEIEEAL